MKIITKSFKFAFKFILSSTKPKTKNVIAENKNKFSMFLSENSINDIPNIFFNYKE